MGRSAMANKCSVLFALGLCLVFAVGHYDSESMVEPLEIDMLELPREDSQSFAELSETKASVVAKAEKKIDAKAKKAAKKEKKKAKKAAKKVKKATKKKAAAAKKAAAKKKAAKKAVAKKAKKVEAEAKKDAAKVKNAEQAEKKADAQEEKADAQEEKADASKKAASGSTSCSDFVAKDSPCGLPKATVCKTNMGKKCCSECGAGGKSSKPADKSTAAKEVRRRSPKRRRRSPSPKQMLR